MDTKLLKILDMEIALQMDEVGMRERDEEGDWRLEKIIVPSKSLNRIVGEEIEVR